MNIEYCCEKMMRADVRIHDGHLCMGDVEIYHCPFCGAEIVIPCDEFRTKPEKFIQNLSGMLTKVLRGGDEE